MALVSIGYKGVALPGTEMWFDERKGVMSNEKGRVAFPAKGMGGIYTAGWLKRGPSGIIGTNITDAKDTVVTIMQDLVKETVGNLSSNSDLMQLLISKGVLVVDWQGVCRIHESEYNARRSDTQPREKLIAIQKQLRIAVNGE
jgi:NADPH-dependent glutamate synthase beta subunit-like oxidoreductase